MIDRLRPGGAQSVVLATSRLLDPERFELSVASVMAGAHPGLVEAVRESSRDVLLLEGRGLWDVRLLPRLVGAIRRQRVDLVHTHLAFGDILGGLAGRACGKPVVSTLHSVGGLEAHDHPWRRRALHGLAVRRLPTHVIAVADAVRAWCVETGVPEDRVSVIPNVPLAPLVLPPGFDAARKRAELGLGGGPVLCVPSRLSPQKDHETLLRALPDVARAVPGVTLLVVGEGRLRDRLERLATDLGLDARVRFLGVRVDAVELMAASDVIVNLTRTNEGLPIVVLDAMSLGLPVVATDAGGVAEALEDGETGLLVQPGDVGSVSAALVALLTDPERRNRMGAAARAVSSARYDPHRWIRELEQVYERLARGA